MDAIIVFRAEFARATAEARNTLSRMRAVELENRSAIARSRMALQESSELLLTRI